MTRHTVCRKGAAVRLHGYAPAVVLSVDRADGTVWATCRITGRGPDWRDGRIGPHGYRTGEIVTVRAYHAPPRDLITSSRCGVLWWGGFDIEPTSPLPDQTGE